MPVWVRTIIFSLLVPGSVAGWIPHSWLLRDRSPDFAGWGALGVIPIAIGAAIYLWCAWDFTFTGRGTPGPWDAPRKLVVRGLYRYVRNPMYVGVGLTIWGQAALYRSMELVWYVTICWCTMHLFVMFYEEPTLRATFGAQYEAYTRAVRRWIPRLTPARFE